MIAGLLFLKGTSQELIYSQGKATSVKLPYYDTEVRLQGQKVSIHGKKSIQGRDTLFTPYLPFDPNLQYELWANHIKLATFRPNQLTTERPELLGIYPRDSILPENLLKIHLVFSRPMQQNVAYDHISFFSDKGQLITPHLELTPELWSEDGKVLTLWLDPGRVKRDLERNRRLGKPLEAGRSYTLKIDSLWRDINGQMLSTTRQKKFTMTSPDRLPLNARAWRIVNHRYDEIVLAFDEPMDYLLLRSALVVQSADERIEGEIVTTENERKWVFRPNSTFQKGEYHIFIESRLEDLAGNNLKHAFDHAPGKSDKLANDVLLTFTIN